MKCNSAYISFLTNFNKNIFNNALKNIINRVNNDDFYKKDIDQFVASLAIGKVIDKELKDAIYLSAARIHTFINKIQKIISILRRNPEVFEDIIDNLKGY